MEAALTRTAAGTGANAYLVDVHWLAKSLGIRPPTAARHDFVDGRTRALARFTTESAPARLTTELALARQGIVVLHAEWANGEPPASYLGGHIPGASHFDTDWLESGYPRWLLLDVTVLRQRFSAWGIRGDDTIVVYAEAYDAACRLWWVLRYCGALDVRVLAGGLAAWRAAELPVESAVAASSAINSIANARDGLQTRPAAQRSVPPNDAQPRAGELINTGELRALLGHADTVLIDVRTRDEFVGHISGYDYLDRAGRIPGAIHAAIEPLNDLLDAWDFAGIAAYWHNCGVPLPAIDALGGDPARALPNRHAAREQATIFYCGSGWRSSIAMFCAACLGIVARNYSDGWCAWSTHYVADPTAAGGTPGWRQDATNNPIARD